MNMLKSCALFVKVTDQGRDSIVDILEFESIPEVADKNVLAHVGHVSLRVLRLWMERKCGFPEDARCVW